MRNQKRLYFYLAYAGTIPFLLCAILFAFKIQKIPILGNLSTVISVYSLVIASFMAGAHWGQHLNQNGKWPLFLSVTSNIVAVLLWLSYLVLPFGGFLMAVAAIFTLLLLIDKKLFQAHLITQPYYQARYIVSLIVIISLIIIEVCI